MDSFARQALSRHSDDVQPAKTGAVSYDRTERDDIVLDARHAPDKCVFANANRLMDGGQPAQDRMIADLAMPAQCGVVDQRDVVADQAIVSHVGADQEQAMIAHLRHHSPVLRPRIDRDVLSDGTVTADLQAAGLALVFAILRGKADARKRENLGFRTDDGIASEHHLAMKADALAETDGRAHDAIRTDRSSLGQVRTTFDDCRRMDTRQLQDSTIIAVTSASATLVPSTRASQANFQMLARRRTFLT